MGAKLKILSSILILSMCGCATTEEKQARQAEKERLEEQRQAEEARLEEESQKRIAEMIEQRQAEEAKKQEQILEKVDQKYGTPDRALMTLGVPTNRTEGDEVLILEYRWSECACNAIISYDKKTKELINPNITPCQFHGYKRFGLPELD